MSRLQPSRMPALNPIDRPPSLQSAAAEVFRLENAYGTALYAAATTVLTPDELLEFSPHTIRLELQDSLQLPEIDNENFGRLMAAISIASTDLFYRDVPSFIEICNIMAGNPPVVGLFDPADAWEVAWAVSESQMLNTGEEDIVFSDEVRSYIGYALDSEGFFSPPPILKMAVMPKKAVPTEITEDAELAAAIVAAEQQRHRDLEEMLIDNTRQMVEQLVKISGPLNR